MILAIITSSTNDEQVVVTASQLAKQMKSPLNLLYVIEVDRKYPIDMEVPMETEKGEKILSWVEEIAGKHKVKSKGEILQARFAGSAILSQAENINADIIVLEHAKSFSDNLYNNISEYVAGNARCAVIMCAGFNQ